MRIDENIMKAFGAFAYIAAWGCIAVLTLYFFGALVAIAAVFIAGGFVARRLLP